ncbi:anti-sigma factor antagonist [Nocardia sp. NPDC051756]|uniref:anti-sigma factor antagonist n=1 Tax=Nocardia sp. NPDC051756 TaxID=3154751 RepID=UPI003419E3CB
MPTAEQAHRPAGTRCSIEAGVHDGANVLRVGGEIDVLTAPALDAAITDVMAADDAALGVVVDLSAVSFLASAGLAVMAAAAQSASRGNRLVVVANNSATLRPMQVTGLTGLLSVCATVTQACVALRGGRAAVDEVTGSVEASG